MLLSPYNICKRTFLMDPLSDILSLLKTRAYVAGGITAGGQWSVRFPGHKVIKCYSVITGECWLSVENVKEPVRLRAGSCLLLPRGWPFVLASDLTLSPMDGLELRSTQERYNGILSVSPGEDVFILGSHFQLEGDARFLLDILPPIVMLQNELQKESLRWAVERMLREMRDPQPGSTLIAQQVAYTLLIEALRLHLVDDLQCGTGWLFALADNRMAAALSSLHQEPARAWTLQELARSAGMSRTAFAQTFKKTVGKPPMEYLTHWRMTLAAKRRLQPGETISSIAPTLGYKSESAFSTAFKRQWGASPREYHRVHCSKLL
jgi:AraC-like DNA-binding protein